MIRPGAAAYQKSGCEAHCGHCFFFAEANCGSCWAFGSVEAMTDRICIASKGAKNVHLSAQDVASCDKLGDMGCNGGVPSTVYTYYKANGIVSGGNGTASLRRRSTGSE